MSPIRLDHRTLLATLAAASLVACSTKDSGATADTAAPAAAAAPGTDSAMRHDSAAMHDSAGGSTAANAAPGGWSAASILAFSGASSEDEIAEGNLAAKKATNAEVKAYARELVRDHEQLRTAGRAYAKEHDIVADTSSGDVRELMDDSREDLKKFTDKAAGAEWDREFLDEQIEDHERALKKLQDAAQNTTDTTLRDMLSKESGKVQEHLTKAKALKERMG